MKALSRLVNRGSLNLEMTLLIALLVLAAVSSLNFLGSGISEIFANTTQRLGVAGGIESGPNDLSTDYTSDGFTRVRWNGGTPPFDIVREGDGSIIDSGIVDRHYDVDTRINPETIIVRDSDGRESDPATLAITPASWTNSLYQISPDRMLPFKEVYAIKLDWDGTDYRFTPTHKIVNSLNTPNRVIAGMPILSIPHSYNVRVYGLDEGWYLFATAIEPDGILTSTVWKSSPPVYVDPSSPYLFDDGGNPTPSPNWADRLEIEESMFGGPLHSEPNQVERYQDYLHSGGDDLY